MNQEMPTVPPARPRPDEPILATKLYVPAPRPKRLPRRQLLDCLSRSCTGPLLLISAPAGFGKTTLLGEWAHTLSSSPLPGEEEKRAVSVAWLSLDSADNDPRRFCRYMVAALQTVAPGAGETIPAAMASPQLPSLETVATLLLNDLCAVTSEEPIQNIVLILDDYHLIDSSAIHDFVSFLVEHLPTHLHMVLATRADPPLPLSLWRARGQMAELRADDLRFSAGETESFLNQVMALHLAKADVAVLAERTEGWIVGLQMAALSLQGRADAAAFVQSFRGSHRYVLDYLLEQVLNRQPPEIQEFLLQTSILERMTAGLCEVVTGAGKIDSPASGFRPPASEILQYLDRSNLFLIPLDDERRWYRYHHLFADLLRARLQQLQPENIPALHRRAASWFAENDLVEEAIQHALKAEDYNQVAVLLESEFSKRRQPGRMRTSWIWTEQLPEELVSTRPLLAGLRAIAALARSQIDEAEALLAIAGEASGAVDPAFRQDLEGLLYMARSISASLHGDAPQIVACARRALELFPWDDPLRMTAAMNLGNAYLLQGELNEAERAWVEGLQVSETTRDPLRRLQSLGNLGWLKQHQARLPEAEAAYRQTWQLAATLGNALFFLSGILKAQYAGLLLERNEPAAAQEMAQNGLEEALQWGSPSGQGIGYLYSGLVRLSRGDLPGALEAAQKAGGILQRYTVYPDLVAAVRCLQARVAMARGEMEEAGQMLDECAGEEWWDHLLLREWVEIVQAQLLLRQNRPKEALELLEGKAAAAHAAGRGRNRIEILVLQALAKQDLSEREAACRTLARALAAAEEQGMVRILLDYGPPLAELLRYGLKRQIWDPGRITAYAQKLLATGEGASEAAPEVQAPVPAGFSLPEPLTERELEVLRLLAAGLSNQDIARKLVLTVGTVKTHVHNIYGKLQVESRTQAVARARGTGLV